jgi:hypothetical protein
MTNLIQYVSNKLTEEFNAKFESCERLIKTKSMIDIIVGKINIDIQGPKVFELSEQKLFSNRQIG